MPEGSVRQAALERRFNRIREKVLQHCKDFWRAYHGSTRHREEDDGNQMVEKKKVGGHTPLNAAVWEQRKPGKLRDSREEFGRQLYRLAMGSPPEVVCFAEIQDLFGRYGAGDSDYDLLAAKARENSPGSESARKLHAVDFGIDLITTRLIESGITNRDFWAQFGWEAMPTAKKLTADEQKRQRYLVYLDHRKKLSAERKPDGSPRYKRVTNKALIAAAEECGVTKQTIITAVQACESGYLTEAS